MKKILDSYVGGLDSNFVNKGEYLVYNGKNIPEKEPKSRLNFKRLNTRDTSYGLTHFDIEGFERHYWYLRKGGSHFYALNENAYGLDKTKTTLPEFWFNLIDSIPIRLFEGYFGYEETKGIVYEITKGFEERNANIRVITSYHDVYEEEHMLIQFSLLNKTEKSFWKKLITADIKGLANIKFQGAAFFVNSQKCIDWMYLNLNNFGDYCAISPDAHKRHNGKRDGYREKYNSVRI